MNGPAEVEVLVLGRAVPSSVKTDRSTSCTDLVQKRYHQLTKGAPVHE